VSTPAYRQAGLSGPGLWFDKSFDIAHDLEFIEGLTLLSEVEGQTGESNGWILGICYFDRNVRRPAKTGWAASFLFGI